MALDQTKTKVCAKCGFRKPVDFFGRDRSSADGFQRTCSQCDKEYRNGNRGRIKGDKALDDV